MATTRVVDAGNGQRRAATLGAVRSRALDGVQDEVA